ncbi:MAG: hypothetical protein ABEH40_02610 [Haloferacaceae archaeon]
MSDANEGGRAGDASGTGDRTPRERMRRAVRAVRREGRKAAAIGAAAEAVAVVLAANLALDVAAELLPGALDRSVPLPVPGGRPAAAPLPASVDATVVVAVGAGALAGAVAYRLRVRRPTVERFEAVNPPVAEALRTARDALAAGRDGPMADRLYESVLDRLERCSSLGLLGVRRLAVTVAVVVLLGAANVGVTVVDPGLGLGGGPGEPAAASGGAPAADSDEYGGLRNPDEVLGDPEDVSAGDETLNASVPARGSGNGSGSTGSYPTGGFAGSTSVESQQAGFAEAERLEDAELIREYNLRIREEDG